MSDHALFSTNTPQLTWGAVEPLELVYGPKGARLLTLPRAWTPHFALIPWSQTGKKKQLEGTIEDNWEKLVALAAITGQVTIRSSVVGETIWDRGSYHSEVVDATLGLKRKNVLHAARAVVDSAGGKPIALVLQSYVNSKSKGEFGNLLRVSKTRDHWELSATIEGASSRIRFNAQRDRAARQDESVAIRSGVPRERLFGSLAAWINNELLRGHPQRVNCEWVTDNRHIFIVQLDKEDEDYSGANPLQVAIEPAYTPQQKDGRYFRAADAAARATWDKLTVLNELWAQEGPISRCSSMRRLI